MIESERELSWAAFNEAYDRGERRAEAVQNGPCTECIEGRGQDGERGQGGERGPGGPRRGFSDK